MQQSEQKTPNSAPSRPGDWAETEYQARAAVLVQESQIRGLGSGEWAETECQGRAAVVIEPVSANSLCETGVFRETAGDFPLFRPGV